ncbi:MAG TPA: hypothetical protein VN229_09185 [Terriglobales bacterium]|nr:hypothetical protein [Terriglobales bacterium]
MLRFDCAPAVPAGYAKLMFLSPGELDLARLHGYVGDPGGDICRAGEDASDLPLPTNVLSDWRCRLYIIWFCYLYENLAAMPRPMGAIEELVLEFKAPVILDFRGRRIGALYAGAGADDPLLPEDLARELKALAPHYRLALSLLGSIEPSA